jgi:glyoxylase-like metal-dependent hydrolase (beta-lactamase superfamily II)
MNPHQMAMLPDRPDARLQVESFFDAATFTWSHLVLDRQTRQCALVDSVLDYDPKSGRARTTGADRLIARVRELGAQVQWLLETHVHADHLSAAQHRTQALGGQLAIGAHITQVQRTFAAVFNAGRSFARDGSQFDCLLAEGDCFQIGGLPVRVMHTPGHTPACLTYVVESEGATAAFVGDTLFMPDYGTARCDFPGGEARALYRSIQRVLALPAQARLFLCHDYPPAGRAPAPSCTVAEQRAGNVQVHEGIDEDQFVAMRQARDATLEMPVLLLPSVQVNMRGGRWPEPEDNGVSYLKIPVNLL